MTLSGILPALLFLGYVVLWKIKKRELFKKTGVNADVFLKSTKPIQSYFRHLEPLMTIFIVIIILLHLLPIAFFGLTEPIHYFNRDLFDYIGFFVGIAGLTLCRLAQVTIGASWRVGIDEKASPGLISKGIYAYIRNPTYTGMFILCAGVFLISPTILYSYWILSFFLIMEFQVRCEEEYLENQYGEAYSHYFSRTKRYLPIIY